MDNDLFPDIAARINSLSEKIPPYLEEVGLNHPPFDSELSEGFYYEEPLRTQRFNLLLHLAQFSDLLHVVIGPKGCGKSALLQRIEEQSQSTWQVCRITATPTLSFEQALTQLAAKMDVSEQTPLEQLLPALLEQLSSFFFTTTRAVLMVDEAHLLSQRTLQQIIQLTNNKDKEGKTLLHLILAGERTLLEKTQTPEIKSLLEHPAKILELKPFTFEQSKEYLEHRLHAAELSQASPFSEKDVRIIYKESSGLPGRINKLAHQHLLHQPKKGDGLALLKNLFTPKKSLAWLFASLALILLIPMVIYQDEINQLFVAAPNSEMAQNNTLDSRLHKPLGLPLADVIGTDQTKEPASLSTEHEQAAAVHSEQTPVTAAVTSEPHLPAPIEPEKIPSMEITTTDTTVKTVHTAPIAAPTQPTSPLSAEMQWLMQQEKKHYTLQLLATANQATIKKFIKNNQLDNSNIATYRTRRNNKEWFALVYGSYPDRKSALVASDALKLQINALEPWPRSFGSIHMILAPATK